MEKSVMAANRLEKGTTEKSVTAADRREKDAAEKSVTAADRLEKDAAEKSVTAADRLEKTMTAEELKDRLDTKKLDLRTYSPLTLAFIGDGIYDLVIRTMMVKEANTSNNLLHRRTAALVKAQSQAAAADGILPLLSEEEKQVYMRGRNAKMATMAKNATVSDYKKATGLEALLGYLYLKGSYDRMLELIAAGLSV